MPNTDPHLVPDAAARALAQDLLRLPHAALAWSYPETGTPGISRIAFGLGPQGGPMSLISSLAPHFAALQAHPDCAVMLGEAKAQGDPLAHPRLMIRAKAQFVAPDDPERSALRAHWLKDHPKAALYIDFTDFALVRLHPLSALLNAGFAKAYRLTAQDLAL